VKGHTGSRGDSTANLKLSQARAETVKRYLAVTHGVNENRMRAVGFGGTRPLQRNPGETDRALQYRLPRVELSLMSEVY
jgi:outer membrane protein OmpA-like peptidoglycan-associated protein